MSKVGYPAEDDLRFWVSILSESELKDHLPLDVAMSRAAPEAVVDDLTREFSGMCIVLP